MTKFIQYEPNKPRRKYLEHDQDGIPLALKRVRMGYLPAENCHPRNMVLLSAQYRYDVIESPLHRDKVSITASVALARYFTADEWKEIESDYLDEAVKLLKGAPLLPYWANYVQLLLKESSEYARQAMSEICLEIWEPMAFINDVICHYNNPKAPPIPLDSGGHRVPSSSTPPLDTTSAPPPKRRRSGPPPPRASQTAAEPSSTATVRPDPRPKTSMSRPSERTALEPSTPNPNSWRQTVLTPSPRTLSDTRQQNRDLTLVETPTVLPINSLQQPSLENSTSRKADGKTCLQADDLSAERRNISMRLHRSGAGAGVIDKMPSEHVRHLYTVLEPGNLGVGIRHGELPRDYLRFWRCWEKSKVFGVERALGMNSSSCFSAWLEEDGDVDIRFKVRRDEGVRWIVGRHSPMTWGKRRHVKPRPSRSF